MKKEKLDVLMGRNTIFLSDPPPSHYFITPELKEELKQDGKALASWATEAQSISILGYPDAFY